MDDEAEPSGAAQRHGEPLEDDEELHRLQGKEKLARERRLDAKRKRIRMLNDVLRDIDLAVYMELITVYYLECETAVSAPNARLTAAAAARSSG
jgi:hypothetical protein